MSTHPPLTARELAVTRKDEIFAAIAERYGLPAQELTLLEDGASESEAEPGTYVFMAAHATGVFGVHGTPLEDGSMRFVATSL